MDKEKTSKEQQVIIDKIAILRKEKNSLIKQTMEVREIWRQYVRNIDDMLMMEALKQGAHKRYFKQEPSKTLREYDHSKALACLLLLAKSDIRIQGYKSELSDLLCEAWRNEAPMKDIANALGMTFMTAYRTITRYDWFKVRYNMQGK